MALEPSLSARSGSLPLIVTQSSSANVAETDGLAAADDLSGRHRSSKSSGSTSGKADAEADAPQSPQAGGARADGTTAHRHKHDIRKPDRKQQRRGILESPPENRTESDLFGLDELLVHCEALRGICSNARLRLARSATLMSFEDGKTIYAVGDPAPLLYVILSGEVLCERNGQSCVVREGHSLGKLSSGVVEQAPMGAFYSSFSAPRVRDLGQWDQSATAMGPVDCAVILQTTWTRVREEEPTWDVQKVATFLEDVPIFGTLSPTQLMNLSRMLTIVRRSAGSVIYQKGFTGDDLYLIRFGYVRLLRSVVLDSVCRQRLNKVAGEVTLMRAKLEQGKKFGVLLGKAAGPCVVVPRDTIRPPPRSASTSPTRAKSPMRAGSQPHHTLIPKWDKGGPKSPTGGKHGTGPLAAAHHHHKAAPAPNMRASMNGLSTINLDVSPSGRGGSAAHGGGGGGHSPAPNAAGLSAILAAARGGVAGDGGDDDDDDDSEDDDAAGVSAVLRKLNNDFDASKGGEASAGRLGGSPTMRTSPTHRGTPSPGHLIGLAGTLRRNYVDAVASAGAESHGLSDTHADPDAPVPARQLPAAMRRVVGTSGVAARKDGDRAFTVHAPRQLVDGDDDELSVEVALVTSGQCFGEAARASASPHAATAIADTAVELLVMNHHELKARMGAAAVAELAFLWTLESLENGGTASSDQHAGHFYPGNSDEGIKQQLHQSMEWELFKKRLVTNIVSSKASAIAALRR